MNLSIEEIKSLILASLAEEGVVPFAGDAVGTGVGVADCFVDRVDENRGPA